MGDPLDVNIDVIEVFIGELTAGDSVPEPANDQ
jgi:hypothetical protein